MKIAVIGAGGVGGYFGAKLAQAGNEVTFLARNEHLSAMKTNGLTVRSFLGDFRVTDIRATDNIAEISHPDLAILGVKAWQIKEIRDDLKEIIHAKSMILPFQNGVLAAEELMEVMDKSNVLGGLCRIISKIESPGVINHMGAVPEIIFGELDKSVSTRVRELKNVFDKAEIDSKISKDIESELWKKFILICVGGLLAMTKKTFGELREQDKLRQMMIDLLDEIYELAKKVGVRMEPEIVRKTVDFIDTFPLNATFSLTIDVWNGRPSEIEY
jgi:2-dehydropantoate 2-reductase